MSYSVRTRKKGPKSAACRLTKIGFTGFNVLPSTYHGPTTANKFGPDNQLPPPVRRGEAATKRKTTDHQGKSDEVPPFPVIQLQFQKFGGPFEALNVIWR